MTPLALELEGFTCYRSRVRIDWSDVGTGLFAVTGPTGAGKSTLLDAITYVLYGRTARLGSRGLEALLSPGADAMFVQLTFRNARGVYRVTRAAQRRGSGTVGTEVRVEVADAENGVDGWRQLSDSERVRDANEALQELVGLDYDGFTRAVLLPQGAFDEFLRGDVAQRRRLLVSLLGLDRVGEIQRLAGQRAGLAEERVAGLRTRLAEDYADVDPGAVREMRDAEAELTEQAEALEREVAAREAELGEVEETARLVGERATLGRRRERLVRDAARVATLKEELERGRRAAVLAPQVPRAEAADRRVAAAHTALAARREGEAQAAARLEAARAALGAAEAEARERQGAIAAELGALAEVAPAFEALKRRGGSLELAAQAPVAELLDEEAWGGWQTALSLVPGLERAEREVERRAAALAGERRALEEATRRSERLELELSERVERGKALAAEEAEARGALEAARRADLAAAVRAGLAPDDACPVCGGRVGDHTPATAHADLAAAERALAEAGAAVERARAEYQERRAELAKAQAERAGHAKQAEAAERALADARSELAEARAELERHGAGLAGLAAPGDAPTGDGATPTAPRVRAALEARRAAALAAHARAVAERLEAAGLPKASLTDPAGRARQLEAESEALGARVRAAEQAVQGAERALDVARAQREAAEEGAAAAAEEACAVREALAEAVTAAGFTDLAEAQGALREPADLERLEAEVTAHEQELRAVEAREVELDAAIAARPPLPRPTGPDDEPVDAGTLAEGLRAQLNGKRAALAELNQRRGELSAQRRSLETRLERSSELRKQLAQAEDEYELHRQLALDLRGNNFPDHLMAQVQQRLARRASQVLRHVTDGRYDLLLEGGDYLVADAWAGGELRSARTLSGGESFVASLALALALSDTLAGNAALGALFLDEGFGTLDRATLEAVTSVLESLTDEGRMVGVITHVPELSERLPARLVVSKGPAGSTVAWDA